VVAANLCFGAVERPGMPINGPSEMFFVTSELCPHGELFDLLFPPRAPHVRPFGEPVARRLFGDICAGLEHMHLHGMFHMDLRLENLVVDHDFSVRIMDFGHAIYDHDWESPRPKPAAEDTPGPHDVWSLGVILFFLCCSTELQKLAQARRTRRPFTRIDFRALLQNDWCEDTRAPKNAALWCEMDRHGSTASNELRVLLNRCLNRTAADRPSVREVLSSEWMAGAKTDLGELKQELSTRR